MSYPKPWAKTFKASELAVTHPETPFREGQPHVCDEGHKMIDGETTCLECETWVTDIKQSRGNWRLRNPIQVQSVMPGWDHKLQIISVSGCYMKDATASIWADAILKVLGDNSVVYDTGRLTLKHTTDENVQLNTIMRLLQCMEDYG